MPDLPAKVPERTWVVDASGTAIERKPPAKPLGRHQRHAAYRLGLQKVLGFLEASGFQCNCIEQSSISISVERAGCCFDIRLQKPGKVAYVTSGSSYRYEDETIGIAQDGSALKKVNAVVSLLSSEIKSELALQVVASHVSSSAPLFIELPEDLPDPEYYVIRATLAALVDLSATFPRLKADGQKILELVEGGDVKALPAVDFDKFR